MARQKLQNEGLLTDTAEEGVRSKVLQYYTPQAKYTQMSEWDGHDPKMTDPHRENPQAIFEKQQGFRGKSDLLKGTSSQNGVRPFAESEARSFAMVINQERVTEALAEIHEQWKYPNARRVHEKLCKQIEDAEKQHQREDAERKQKQREEILKWSSERKRR